jgi:FkbM family methyltransferase
VNDVASPFISFAQNFEDVVLWRVLGHVRAGFYIDVGAGSPEVDSVTKAFYDRGWSGINVEPHPSLHRELDAARPRDTNLCVAIGDHEGMATLTVAEHAALSTLDADQARVLHASGMPTSLREVALRTLESVWGEYVPVGQDVHFLKIDVEGYERSVIQGGAWRSQRPWLVVVEATRPQTVEPSHGRWEPLLIGGGYGLVYEDGLNRYYVADEHEELAPSFAFPPNVFDHFVPVSVIRANERAVRAEEALAAMFASRSWRVTAPMRAVAQWFRRRRSHHRA